MSTVSPNLGLTLAEGPDVVNVSTHVAGNFSTLDSKWSSPGTPQAVQVGAAGSPGASTVVARTDHIHGVAVGTPVATSTANSAGSASTVAASDHIHKTGDNSVATATIQDSAVTAAKIAAGAIVSALGYTPANKAGEAFGGAISVPFNSSFQAKDSGGVARSVAAIVTGDVVELGNSNFGINRLYAFTNDGLKARYASGAGANTDYTVWHAGNDGAASGLDSDQLDGQHGSYYQARSNHTGTQTASTISDLSSAVALLTAATVADNGITEAKLDVIDSPADNEALTYDSATGRLEWQAVSALVNSVPSGLVAMVRTAAEIPSGWTRETNLDGRYPIGAGTTFSVTFLEANNYDTGTWYHSHTGPSHTHTGPSHTHTGPSHTHGAAALGISGSTGGPSALDGLGNNGGTNTPSTGHTHNQGSLDVTGATDADGTGATGADGTGATGAAGTGATGDAGFFFPSRAYVYMRKS